MKRTLEIAALAIAVGLIAGCANSGKINTVSAGMTKQEVIGAMGAPDTVSAKDGAEYLSYFLCYSNCAALIVENRGRDWYYVRLVNGKVDSYGKKGDFDSTKVPVTRVERVETIKQDVRIQDSREPQAGDKYAELTKLRALFDSGTLTKDEFEEQKKRILAR